MTLIHLPPVRTRDFTVEGIGASPLTTVLVEAHYRLSSQGALVPLADAEPAPHERLHITPWKAHAEVLVAGAGTAAGVVACSIARGADLLVGKSLARLTEGGPLVHPDRDAEALGLSATFDVVPADAVQRQRTWSGRAPIDLSSSRLHLPQDVDLRSFQAASPDQWMTPLRGGEQILLEGFGGLTGVRKLRLPSVVVHAEVLDAAHQRRLPLRGDTLWIDPPAGRVTIAYRGILSGDDAARARTGDVRAIVAPSPDHERAHGAPFVWTRARLSSAARRSPAVSCFRCDHDEGFAVGQTVWPSRGPEAAPIPAHLASRSLSARRTVIAKATFDFDADGRALLVAEPEPLATGSDGDGGALACPSDFAPHKARVDVLVRGFAYPTAGASSAVVRMELSQSNGATRFVKELLVLGPRAWQRDGHPTAPQPFDRHPLHASHDGDGSSAARIEHAAEAARARTDRRTPAGFGPRAPTRPPASSGLVDWPVALGAGSASAWQSAPEDQQLPADRAGPKPSAGWASASFSMSSVCVAGGRFTGTLPGLRPRASVLVGGAAPFELAMSLDTITLEPERRRAHLVWRAAYDVVVGVGRADERVVVVEDPASAPMAVDCLLANAVVCASEDWQFTAPRHRRAKRRAERSLPGGGGDARRAIEAWLATPTVGAELARTPPPRRPPPPTRRAVLAWLASELPVAGRDLSHVELSGASLVGADLRGAILAFADLRDADLTFAVLDDTILTGAQLGGARLHRASLVRADLTGARLEGAILSEARLDGAAFSSATLDRATFDQASGTGVRFVGAAAVAAQFRSTTLPKADFTRAVLRDAVFAGASLPGARFDEAVGAGANFDQATIDDGSFESADLPGATLRGASAMRASFECANLTNANLSRAKLDGASLNAASLGSADLSDAQGLDVSMREADLTRVNLSGARLRRASLEAALLPVSLDGVDLHDADLFLTTRAPRPRG